MNKLAASINRTIQKSQHILLHLHPSPDADSAGSALALYHYLTSLGKNVTLISGDNNPSPALMTLPGAKKITRKNILDLNLQKFDLFIILDSSDLRQVSQLGEIKLPPTLATIVIDHHASNSSYGQLNLVDCHSPATCQIVFELLKSFKAKITPDIALCLFAGIYSDTGGFKYNSTTSRTFSICTQLTKIAPNFSQTIFNLENNDRPDRLKLLGLHLNHIETFFKNQVAISSLSEKDIKKNHINPEDSVNGEIANYLKSVIGWQIGISMIEAAKNKVMVSFRTRDSGKYDLSLIARSTGFGGGHRAAAGALIPLSLPKAQILILQTINKLYPEIAKY